MPRRRDTSQDITTRHVVVLCGRVIVFAVQRSLSCCSVTTANADWPTFTQGDAVWASYLGFEQRVLAEQRDAPNPSDTDSQAQIVLKLFHRRLGIPLPGLEASQRECATWYARLVPDPSCLQIFVSSTEVVGAANG